MLLINLSLIKLFIFAAESHVDRSIDGPMTFVNTNLVGTATLLDVLNNFIKEQTSEFKQNFKMIHISTDEVYGSLGKKDSSMKKLAMILALLILLLKQGRTI